METNEQRATEARGQVNVWGRPPVMSQRKALLPDGNEDPDNLSDCGEACVSSIVMGRRHIYISPGCIRQSLGERSHAGLTDELALSWVLERLGISAVPMYMGPHAAWDRLHRLRRVRHWVITLGAWISPSEFHWMVGYEGTGHLLWFMDPWQGDYRALNRSQFDAGYAGTLVVIS